jgi:hypothetical protein
VVGLATAATLLITRFFRLQRRFTIATGSIHRTEPSPA